MPTAIVSGGTGGIGRIIVKALMVKGYNVIALGRTPAKIAALVQEAEGWGSPGMAGGVPNTCQVIHVDLTIGLGLDMLTDYLKAASSVDVLVTAHGAEPDTTPALQTPAMSAMERFWRTDVLGTFELCRLVGAFMLQQRHGAICLLSSIHALATFPCRTPYATAKAGVIGMARGLAVEWGQYNIRVNAIAPYQVEGPRTQRFIDASSDDLREAYLRRTPMRQLITPGAIAQTVLWLVKTPGITGQVVVMDSGLTASAWHEPFTES